MVHIYVHISMKPLPCGDLMHLFKMCFIVYLDRSWWCIGSSHAGVDLPKVRGPTDACKECPVDRGTPRSTNPWRRHVVFLTTVSIHSRLVYLFFIQHSIQCMSDHKLSVFPSSLLLYFNLCSTFSPLPFNLSLPTSDNAEAMQEDLKQQPCMIERLYGKLYGIGRHEKNQNFVT